MAFSFTIFKNDIRFDRNELSGAFGDIGTDLPLIIGMLLSTNLQTANVLVLFGVMQILTSVVYGMPLAVQPLKAVALIVITQHISGNIILAGGLAIGVIMLILSLSNLLTILGKIIPKTVIRGIQLGLGFQLCSIALKEYIPSDGISGYILASIAFIVTLIFIGNRKFPPAIIIILGGFIYAIAFSFKPEVFHIDIPEFKLTSFTFKDIWTGFAILSLPQIPLSLGNSIFATKQVASDLYPEKKVTIKKIGLTYSIMNILSSFLGGIPTCHGSGGMIGHYTFGGRTGGSTIIYGTMYIILGLIFSTNFSEFVLLFPKPILGVILIFEGIALIVLVKDIIVNKKAFFIAVLVATMAIGIPYGYLIGMISGTLIYYGANKIVLKNYGK